MATIYGDYSRDKIGWFFGLSGWQLATLAATVMPVFWAIQHGAWLPAVLFAGLWGLVLVVAVAPVRGRSATGWLAASSAFAIGGLAGWTRFRSRASTGKSEALAEADLTGVLQGVQIHDGPPQGPSLSVADRDHPGPRRQDLGGHRRHGPPRHRHERCARPAPAGHGAVRAARPGLTD